MNYKFAASQGTGALGGNRAIGGDPSEAQQRQMMRGASKQGTANASGYVLQPKQMVFGADKKLVPSVESNQELMGSGQFKGINSYGNMVNAG